MLPVCSRPKIRPDLSPKVTFIQISAVTLQLGPDTKALAYALFDRAVFSMKVKKHHISVLAATCLMIATKLLEDHVCRDLGKFLIRQANLTFGKVKITL